MVYTMLLVGNGLEANYNSKMRNFNKNFFEWVANDLSGENEFNDLVLGIEEEIGELSEEFISLLESFIFKIADDYKVGKINIVNYSIEDYFAKFGAGVQNNSKDKTQEKLIFSVVTTLFGYFIDINTWEANEKFEESYLIAHPADDERYQVILTTNYTDSPEILANSFVDRFLQTEKPDVIYLHGKFVPHKDRYQDIQVNLVNKNVEIAFKNLKKIINKTNKDEINLFYLDIFGHSLEKDLHILEELINLSILYQNDINIDYYAYENKDDIKETIWEEIAAWENSEISIYQNNYYIKLKEYKKKENYIELEIWKKMPNYYYATNQDELISKIWIDFLDSRDFFLYKDLQHDSFQQKFIELNKEVYDSNDELKSIQ